MIFRLKSLSLLPVFLALVELRVASSFAYRPCNTLNYYFSKTAIWWYDTLF